MPIRLPWRRSSIVGCFGRPSRVGMDLDAFNARLLQLFMVIPRKMKNVRDNLIAAAVDQTALDNIQMRLSNEQATLGVMRSQVE